MGRLLSQLRCVSCGHAYWPERSQAAEHFLPCPRCGALHVNARAEGLPPAEGWTRIGELDAWMERYWIGPPPSVPYSKGLFSHATGVRFLELDGFASVVVPVNMPVGRSRTYGAFLLVAAKAPVPAPIPTVLGAPSIWAPGAWAPAGWWQYRWDLEKYPLAPLAAELRRGGAVPVLPYREVEQPTPLERSDVDLRRDDEGDRRLASMRVECAKCGAPASPVDLASGGRCPWCGSPIAMEPELAGALAAYHARVAAALRSARDPMPTMRSEATPPIRLGAGQVELACVRCGAPNANRPGARDEVCASCRAPLVPSARARAIGLEMAGRLSEEAYERGGVLRARRTWIELRHLRTDEVAVLVCFALGSTAATWVGFYKGLVAMLLCAAAGWLGIFAWVLGRGLLAGFLALRWRRRFAALGEQLGRRAIGDSRALSAWTARNWRGDRIPGSWLVPGPAFGTVGTMIMGFPVALAARVEAPRSLLAPAKPPFAAVLLAARLPRDTAYWLATPEAQSVVSWLERCGLTLEVRLGGLLACASPQRLAAYRARPAALSELAPVSFALGRLAHLLRAEPHDSPAPPAPAPR